jgi:hypothetical protein
MSVDVEIYFAMREMLSCNLQMNASDSALYDNSQNMAQCRKLDS